jgi:hypothetical protein
VPVAEQAVQLYSREDFLPLVNTAFHTANTEPQVELELTEATALKFYPGPGRQDPFVLLFRGPASPALPQAMFQLTAGGAIFEMFLVPVGIDATVRLYEAIFN